MNWHVSIIVSCNTIKQAREILEFELPQKEADRTLWSERSYYLSAHVPAFLIAVVSDKKLS
jgi:hypothetical protein